MNRKATPDHHDNEVRDSILRVIRRSPPLLLMGVLLLDIMLSPLLDGWGGRAINVAVIAACLGIAADNRRSLTLGLWLAIPAVLLILVGEILGDRRVNLASYPFMLFLYLHIIRLMLAKIFGARVVTLDTIGLALCTYVLLGVLWLLFYIPVVLFDPDAFAFANLSADGKPMGEMLYFSYVTLTTLGYGDVAPVSPLAQGLAITEALTGVLFLAVLISRLVGSYSAQRR